MCDVCCGVCGVVWGGVLWCVWCGVCWCAVVCVVCCFVCVHVVLLCVVCVVCCFVCVHVVLCVWCWCCVWCACLTTKGSFARTHFPHRTQIWPLAVSLAAGALFGVRRSSGSGGGKGWPATSRRSYCRVGVCDACRAHAENLLSSNSAFFRSQRSINDAK